ncbi:copper amine oxidase N-terminal domain-containing protein [Cohnella xylanilytica]|uniref:Copper amine oxidase N-terminal domain-containing protein n=1 Tax=Cohnella xylanilytica TaxID=557555 RepID=A0A841U120_9BACL|nr:copper amine oxidase N-terminal domain-containing protein [Cohnella xylanilytica]MBB6694226.1 copper amine oxidase N-terminal domain-containing protein [Cohnella xylanilytica]
MSIRKSNRKPIEFAIVSSVALAAIIGCSMLPVAKAEVTPSARPSAALSVQISKPSGIRLVLNGGEYEPKSAPLLFNNAVYLPLREMGEMLGSVVSWTASTKVVTMTYPNLVVKLDYGSKKATINGKDVPLTMPLRSVKGQIYVPLRFFSEATGAKVEWKANRTIRIEKKDEYIRGGGVNVSAWLNRQTKELYLAHPYERAPVPVGKVDAELNDWISVGVDVHGSGIQMVTVTDIYGEPHVQYAVNSLLVRDGKIVSQKKASYFQRYEPNLTYYQYYAPSVPEWVQNYVLTDGRTVTVFDEQGAAKQEYDLPKLTGQDDTYAVLGAGQSFLVVRPSKTGLLTLIDLRTGQSTVLCDKLLSGDDLEYARNNDVPYRGDNLRFAGYSDDEGELYFDYDSPLDSKSDSVRLTYRRTSGN